MNTHSAHVCVCVCVYFTPVHYWHMKLPTVIYNVQYSPVSPDDIRTRKMCPLLHNLLHIDPFFFLYSLALPLWSDAGVFFWGCILYRPSVDHTKVSSQLLHAGPKSYVMHSYLKLTCVCGDGWVHFLFTVRMAPYYVGQCERSQQISCVGTICTGVSRYVYCSRACVHMCSQDTDLMVTNCGKLVHMFRFPRCWRLSAMCSRVG